tara:strand:+ start:202 stop:552 length:351 start_codon:yes stop_codon:yes gene_type:complete
MGQGKKQIGIIMGKNRLVMLDDMITKSKKTLVDSIPVDTTYVFKTKPSNCPHCHNESIIGVDIMGGYSGNLLWECEGCESVFLRFKEEETEGYLQEAKGAWTNPNDWGYVHKSKFN